MVSICFSGQTIFGFFQIEGITLDAGEEVDEIAEQANAWVLIG